MSVAIEFAPEFDPEVLPVPRPLRTAPAAPARLAPVIRLHPPADPPVAAPLRLTRRGVVALAVLVGLLGLGLVWLGRLSAPASPAAGPAHGTVTVQPGDTLWSIASRVAPNADPRAEVAALQQRNRLAGPDLVPGQRLQLP